MEYANKPLNMGNTLKFLIAAVLMTSVTGKAIAYPNQGPLPTPMGPSFFKRLTDGFNQDGTLVANPIVTINDGSDPILVTCGDSQCLQKTLTNNNTLTFDGNTYTVYVNIPDYMTITNAYGNLPPQYPPTAELGSYQITNPIPGMINGGAATPLVGPPALSAFTGETVYTVTANNTGNADSYYIPNIPNSGFAAHDGLTEHVYWLNDHYLRTGGIITTVPPQHMVAYGWANPAEDVNASVTLQPVAADGGTPCTGAGPALIQQAASPFNYYLNLFDVTYDYANLLAAIPTICPGNNAADTYYLNDLDNPNASINPTWSENGLYTPILAQPGFQRNLIRWYLPWGTWNLLNNTSDLFVRKNGDVEVPSYNDGSDHPFPLVLQSWDSNRFTAINLTDDAIPLVVTNYPGNEAYFPSNIYVPNQAGLIPFYNDFNFWDNTNTLNPRTVDGFLGMKDPIINNATVFFGGPFPAAQDPGGQANKPYLIGPSTANGQYSLRIQHANSIFAAQQLKSTSDQLYAVEYYFDDDMGGGFKKVATFSFQWRPWVVASNGTWADSGSDTVGTFVPLFELNDASFANQITVAQATSFNSSRVFSFDASLYDPSKAASYENDIGNPVTYFTVTLVSTDADAKFLAVMQEVTMPSVDSVTAPTLSMSRALPNSGGTIHINYTTPASGGTGKFSYMAVIPNYGTVACTNNVAMSRFEAQVNRPLLPNTTTVQIITEDMETGETGISNSVIVGQ